MSQTQGADRTEDVLREGIRREGHTTSVGCWRLSCIGTEGQVGWAGRKGIGRLSQGVTISLMCEEQKAAMLLLRAKGPKNVNLMLVSAGTKNF